ncbi:hypothetical protein DW806_01605 [Butyricicoccus sp. AM32-19]|nr:hypothetical protein DW806_01605 [Butyricicoccus sp. AM32-19]RHV85469.1 hypothetical protein DXB00_01270 [Butyricicoccus sp. OF10-2]
MENLFQKLLTSVVIYGIFIMAVGKAAMHRSYLYPHNPTFGALSQGRARFFLHKSRISLLFQHKLCRAGKLPLNLSEKRTARQGANTLTQFMCTGQPVPKSPADASCTGI